MVLELQLANFNIYLGLSLAGFFSGIGSSVGIYLVNKHIIKKTEKILRRITRKKKSEKKNKKKTKGKTK